MVDEQDPSPEYIKGFNQAYKIEREMPEVSHELLNATAKGERFEGMVAGAKQLREEKRTQKRDNIIQKQKALNQKQQHDKKHNRKR